MDTNNELISVIIPMYNAESLIERCVSSVQNGIYQNIEILCIDDGCMDGTVKLVRKLQDEDNRIVVFEQDHTGVSAARNHGLREAKGECDRGTVLLARQKTCFVQMIFCFIR